MNAGETYQQSVTTARKSLFATPLGALGGALFGAIIGIALSKTLWLGERVQQMNLTNTGASPVLVKIDTKRFKGDGEVLIEPGKVGRFIYGEGDELSISRLASFRQTTQRRANTEIDSCRSKRGRQRKH